MIQAILWDLDGTIADTEELHYLSWREALRQEGIDFTYPHFLDGFGRSNLEILPDILGVDASQERMLAISAAKERAFRAMARTQLQPLPGVREWLARFHAAGLGQTISSSAPMANILVMLDALEIADYFWALISGAPLPKGKPDPAVFLRSAAALDLPPSACVVIEDSIHGVEGARRAGMGCVALGERMVAALPHILADGRKTPTVAVANLADFSWNQFVALAQPDRNPDRLSLPQEA